MTRLGLNLNRSFEGEHFLAGLFNHPVVFESPRQIRPHNVDLVRAVLKQGASPGMLVDGSSLLHQAATSGQTELADVFLDAGIPVDSRNAPLEATPLMWAATEGDAKMVQ